MSTVETSLYGVHPAHAETDADGGGGYESPDEYADQGDTRKVRNLQFSYLAATVGLDDKQVLTPIDLPRDTEVNVDQIGLLALQRGEKYHEFYTTAELKRLRSGADDVAAAAAAPSAINISEAGEFELAEWLKAEDPGTGRPPTIDAVLEAVGDDKELAHRMLQAENIATDGQPRRGLEAGLSSIIAA